MHSELMTNASNLGYNILEGSAPVLGIRGLYSVFKKTAVFVLYMFVCVCSYACARVEPELNKLTLQINAMEGTLDPAGGAAGTFANFAPLCVDPLISFNDKGEIVYEAAESYDVNDEQTVWTFYLRENGMWSDGSPVLAEDFINTIHRALLPGSSSYYTSELYVLEGAKEARDNDASAAALAAVGAKALDSRTLQFTMPSPCPYFLKLLSLPVYSPSKAGAATAENPNWYMEPETHPGNGAFHMTRYVQDEIIVMDKNPYYHQADKVELETIELLVISDDMAAVAAYETGEVDTASGLLDTVITQYEGKPDLYYWNMQSSMFMQISLNNAPVMRDPRVRRAFALGIQREDLCTVVGRDIQPSYSYVAKAMLSNSSNQKFSEERPQLFTEDIELARALLAEAGYPGGAGFPELSYKYPNSGNNSDVAIALQAQLKDNLGISIKLEGMEMGVYFAARRSGDYELIRNSWTADYSDPVNYLAQFVSDGGFASAAGISNSLYDELVERSNTETDPHKRNELLHEAEYELIADQFYLIPLYAQVYVGLRNPNISGIEKNDRDESLFRFANIEK